MKRKNKITQEEEIKTLLKLNNQYADSYNLLLVENKQIKQEMSNLKANLRINKPYKLLAMATITNPAHDHTLPIIILTPDT